MYPGTDRGRGHPEDLSGLLGGQTNELDEHECIALLSRELLERPLNVSSGDRGDRCVVGEFDLLAMASP
jgi:hypothetical protein